MDFIVTGVVIIGLIIGVIWAVGRIHIVEEKYYNWVNKCVDRNSFSQSVSHKLFDDILSTELFISKKEVLNRFAAENVRVREDKDALIIEQEGSDVYVRIDCNFDSSDRLAQFTSSFQGKNLIARAFYKELTDRLTLKYGRSTLEDITGFRDASLFNDGDVTINTSIEAVPSANIRRSEVHTEIYTRIRLSKRIYR
jgi:hypothetical protein